MKKITLLFVVLLLAGCSLPRGAALQSEVIRASDDEDAPFAVYPVTADTVAKYASWPPRYATYKWSGSTRGPTSPIIHPGDMIDLVIWDNSQNSLLHSPGAKVVDMQGITVSLDGSIFMPYIGKIYVNGQSPDAARAKIQNALAEILPATQVQINYTAGAGSSVSLVGGVAAPGTFPLPDRNFTVLKLISLGRGVPPPCAIHKFLWYAMVAHCALL